MSTNEKVISLLREAINLLSNQVIVPPVEPVPVPVPEPVVPPPTPPPPPPPPPVEPVKQKNVVESYTTFGKDKSFNPTTGQPVVDSNPSGKLYASRRAIKVPFTPSVGGVLKRIDIAIARRPESVSSGVVTPRKFSVENMSGVTLEEVDLAPLNGQGIYSLLFKEVTELSKGAQYWLVANSSPDGVAGDIWYNGLAGSVTCVLMKPGVTDWQKTSIVSPALAVYVETEVLV